MNAGSAMGRDQEAAEGEATLLGALLRIPYSAIGEAVEHGLHAAGFSEIGSAHLTVLQPLFARPEGARLTDLAAAAHIIKPSMNYLGNHLVAHGSVTREADPDDGRAQRVRLTARGEVAVGTIRALVRETEAAWAG